MHYLKAKLADVDATVAAERQKRLELELRLEETTRELHETQRKLAAHPSVESQAASQAASLPAAEADPPAEEHGEVDSMGGGSSHHLGQWDEPFDFNGSSLPTAALDCERDVAFEAFRAGIAGGAYGGAWPSADFTAPERSAGAHKAEMEAKPLFTAELAEVEAPTVLQQRSAPPPAPSGKPRYPASSASAPSPRREPTATDQGRLGQRPVPIIGEWMSPSTV
jgi:hypothetical protein